MSNNITKVKGQDYTALQEELEARYGVAVAQEIIDQIKKADDQDNKPDYMPVKAVSEALELFRGEAQEIVQKLKDVNSKNLPDGIADLEEKRLQNELEHIFNCYWLSQQAFYKLYHKALKICEAPETYRYDRYTKPTQMILMETSMRVDLFNKAA